MDNNNPIFVGPQLSNIHKDWETSFIGLNVLPLVIGLTGPTKSNKTRVAERLVTKYGFGYVDLNRLIIEKAHMLGYENAWKEYGKAAIDYRQLYDCDYFAVEVMKQIRVMSFSQKRIVVDGILHPKEIDYLKEHNRFELIAVIASEELRISELERWNQQSRDQVLVELSNRDRFEQYNSQSGDQYAPNIDKCLKQAEEFGHIFQINEISISSFYKPIEELITKILSRYNISIS